VSAPEGHDLGLFGPDSVAWRIHTDPVMYIAGFRALGLQLCHPLAAAGVAANSRFREDPWGRLHRTGEWIATTTFRTTEDAERAGRALRTLHAHLPGGVEPETGLAYRIDDPDLLLWVHCTEVESFVSTYRRAGGLLAPGEADQYVREMRESARLVGLHRARVPATEAEIHAYYEDIRPQLRVTELARRTVRWAVAPPMPRLVSLATPARPAWVAIMSISAGLLPRWARRLYGLPGLPTTDRSCSSRAGTTAGGAGAARNLDTDSISSPGAAAPPTARRVTAEKAPRAPR
jgi:uncharacterized protein (DUF2236 family)